MSKLKKIQTNIFTWGFRVQSFVLLQGGKFLKEAQEQVHLRQNFQCFFFLFFTSSIWPGA